MTRRLSLRWRLILLSGALALIFALVLSVLFYVRSERHALEQLEQMLETKLDEVITVIESDEAHATLEAFLLVETEFRYTPYNFYYQIADADGRLLLRSANLGSAQLPIPRQWHQARGARRLDIRTVQSTAISSHSESIRLLSERVDLMIGGAPATRIIQTGVSLRPFEAALGASLRGLVLVVGIGLGAVFLLLWYVTTQALTPVSEMARKATEITATQLRERLPVTGRADELDELAIVLNDMLDRLGASLRHMEQFSADAAHQLRTPLTRIRGELDLILRGKLSDPLKGQLEGIQEELERLSRLCSRLLLLGRLDRQANNASLLNETIETDQVVCDLIEQVTPLAQERGISLRRGDAAGACVRGSRALLTEALLNLLDNAIRYSGPHGLVTVSVDTGGGWVGVSVEDEGPGVPVGEQERIFQPFYRLPAAASGADAEGVGLGLAIVRGIAQAHGGRVEVDSAPGRGSIFRMILPRVAPAGGVVASRRAAALIES